MNCDYRSVIAHVLNKKIVSVTPFAGSDGSSKVEIEMYVPVAGDVARSMHYRLEIRDNNEIHYVMNKRKMIR